MFDTGPVPIAFTACTVKLYAVKFVRPVTPKLVPVVPVRQVPLAQFPAPGAGVTFTW